MVGNDAVSQQILIRVQMTNGRVEEQIEGRNGVMTYMYFKGNIVQVVGKWLTCEAGHELT